MFARKNTFMNTECIFCKIISKQLPSTVVYEDTNFIVIKDINPQAPIHLLVIPKQHISSLNEISNENKQNLSDIWEVIKTVASNLQFDKTGYRTVINTGKSAGQEVQHLHVHVLAGRNFSWPPG